MESFRYPTLKQVRPVPTAKGLTSAARPVKIDWSRGGQPSQIHFADGNVASGSCLRCPDPPCMEYREAELAVSAFPDFPADTTNRVCPTNAIEWPPTSPSPVIAAAACMGCGLCVSRCPASAIHFSHEGIAQLNDRPNAFFRESTDPASSRTVEASASRLKSASVTGVLLSESDALLRRIFGKLARFTPTLGPQFPNLLSRNLLIACGISSAARRRGDTNVRMDLVMGPPGVLSGTAEVEVGVEGFLDAPRDLLDSLAVLSARYSVPKENILTLVIASFLPNQRSDYWQLVRDIHQVLRVPVGVITWAALFVLVWERLQLRISQRNEWCADLDTYSIRAVVERTLKRELRISQGLLGFFESQK